MTTQEIEELQRDLEQLSLETTGEAFLRLLKVIGKLERLLVKLEKKEKMDELDRRYEKD